MALLPDPTVDLDWSGYAGSIHERFRAQAENHPDRTCVLETKSSTHPERCFTYRQIYEASNTLAWYLHNAGITNGDVVMIWAHRSVDLVVAFMGTLASGATMTVLDPAYPPARQKIYLEVSRPRALIKIGRATDENGPLAEVVQDYIDKELELKAQVPELRLIDGGGLFGGQVGADDIFNDVRGLASSPPNVVVGPDSNPTLSFTSGSEGRPKGVLGRHFSLTKYFDWMAERFHLSCESRYTLLSGLAHDPVQRDIFTPLYLGAQLLVPSKEDIQHEKLAEWMHEMKPTVTHLTPAMGQILVGGATAEFPSLEHVFFVGDVLTTKQCRSLRQLAVNANIINMYGTTETQRSVSYFEVPSRARDPEFLCKLKDTVPAGQGMQNVQLLVVDRENRARVCQVGEVGEIFVRAAGLAEGYLGDESLNEQKFLTNWFVDNEKWVGADNKTNKNEPWRRYYKGPRDRLYRTGDLGRYLESGDVECTGRADDQVKIRGFRIELNDIDSNLNQNPLIRDCKTLVRRDRNEEPTLVSYLVPEAAEWRRWLSARELDEVEDDGVEMGPTRVFLKKYRSMQTEVRDHLKSRLPTHSVPSIYIVLDKLPLNPNGKVDKPNLPFPDVTEIVEDASDEDLRSWQSLTTVEKAVAQKWADLIRGINPKTVRRDNNFFDLGGHSLLAQQFLLEVRKGLGADVSINSFYEHPDLASFSSHVEKRIREAGSTETGPSDVQEGDPVYTKSLDELASQLPKRYQTADAKPIGIPGRSTIFLTGATGFLGSYLVRDILDRTIHDVKLIAHVRGAKDSNAALQRLRRSLQGYGLWNDAWLTRLSAVVGDLSKPQLGVDDLTWQRLSQEVDVVIHNGATVHWIRKYQDMMASNVLSTVDAMKLCNEGKAKVFCFVSSTSVLDTDYYINLSEEQTRTGQGAVMEIDDMNGSRTGLGTGYGQTKWVSEQLVREAGRRGLKGSVVRPGYVLGDSQTGVCNVDDFLIRMLKGCIQLSARPRIINTVNAVPVNHVARVVVAAALNPLQDGVDVIHVTAHPRLRMSEYLSILEYYGYKAPEVSYDSWKDELEKFVSAGALEKDQEQHALMPLAHFCMNDLPATTRAPELDDRNAVSVLKADAERWTGVDESSGYGIAREDVGRYLRYLAEIKFISLPTEKGRPLPDIRADIVQAKAVGGTGGRGGAP
ncbi:large subunit of L-aminoadipate-semialdehyde dehydrogenase [Annulohypoxylon maeteangense]|uniref:large subunit of L-aminoadipate-semialdehyde dehydrogenase n=1 Tax=Annulohypoxylon maeteangense TaxID=1927788 RepID=UPI0020072D24|nr:large subunit of L-aminoadipate-semialdehyde dehydrogenase [Annulohypoxylon maeteangense]KAI0879843.1 large subunit of L-aminoadipate-semialdehyde dehydrogenase [Annulohypoxylon maeteangense]